MFKSIGKHIKRGIHKGISHVRHHGKSAIKQIKKHGKHIVSDIKRGVKSTAKDITSTIKDNITHPDQFLTNTANSFLETNGNPQLMLLGAVDKHAYNKVMPIYNKVMDIGRKVTEQVTGGQIPADTTHEIVSNLTDHVKNAIKGENPHLDELLKNAAEIGMNYVHSRIGQKLGEKFGEMAGKDYLQQNLGSPPNQGVDFDDPSNNDDNQSDISRIKAKSQV